MPYASAQAIQDRIGLSALIMLTDRGEVPTGQVGAAVLARAQADADAVIDGYLGGRYRLPLATVPAMVADIALAITAWKLHVTEPEAKTRADYQDALRTLRDIASGVIVLTDLAGLLPEGRDGRGVEVTDRARPFTAENLRGFV